MRQQPLENAPPVRLLPLLLLVVLFVLVKIEALMMLMSCWRACAASGIITTSITVAQTCHLPTIVTCAVSCINCCSFTSCRCCCSSWLVFT